MKDRNTVISYRSDLKKLSSLVSYLEYGDTGTALQIIDEWSNQLSDDLITLEDNLQLFDEDPAGYYLRGINQTLNQIKNSEVMV